MKLIFVVEDNINLREAVSSFLKLEDFKVAEFGLVHNVIDSIEKMNPDLIILDVMLPDGDGFLLAKQIRKKYSCPIIFLTAKDSESNRITGFEIGCDDYVVKPFSPRELVLRVKALLKRSLNTVSEPKSNSWILNNNTMTIDKDLHSVTINNNNVQLTPSEWKILDYLTEAAGIVIDRQQILGACLDYNYDMSERTIITHIKNLRAKLGDLQWIETIRGFGYKFMGKIVQNSIHGEK